MNRYTFLIFFLLLFLIGIIPTNGQVTTSKSSSQFLHQEKPVIDTTAYGQWRQVEDAHITNNGMFVSYIIGSGSVSNNSTTVLTDSSGHWKKILPNVKDVKLTGDSRLAVYLNSDTLFIIKLGRDDVEKIPGVKFFFTSDNGKGEWICFKHKMSDSLIVYNTHSGRRDVYPPTVSAYFAQDGKSLVLQMENPNDNVQSVSFLELNSGKLINAWKGKGLVDIQMNDHTKQVVFVTDSIGYKSFWLYEHGKSFSDLLVNNKILKIDSLWVLDNRVEFGISGKYISFSVRKKEQEINKLVAPNTTLNIWSYFDKKLQSLQMMNEELPPLQSFVMNIDNRLIMQVCGANESIMSASQNKDVYVVRKVANNIDGLETYWNSAGQRTYYMKSIKDGKSVLLKPGRYGMIYISPGGKYVVFYDKEAAGYFTYEVGTGVYRNITQGMKTEWNNFYREDAFVIPRGICGWGRDDGWVLIYDKFDIWRIDPLGVKQPINITNGYGLKNAIIFNLAFPESSDRIFLDTDKLILNAVNIQNKQNGFFEKVINKVGNPELLTMGNYIYQLVDNPYLYNLQIAPIKAKNVDMYVVARMSAAESPNYFLTSNFRQFRQLSYVYPEKIYNWYQTELLTWKRPDGKIGQGVLYKPENFDSLKKYPVIFHYYEKKSFSLNEYLIPENISDGCNINIPTYVSNGYLVFTPDVDYVIGNPAQGTLDAIVSAANYVSQLPFVRSDRMGIGGCSFGGYQTNYVITHSRLFAAAYASSSFSDLVSQFNAVPIGGQSWQNYFENGQGRMGIPLWEDPDAYVRNSPIFYVNKIETPLLLMHTTNDVGIPFSQALEMYTALRRLGKKVWLLEYTDGNHGVWGKSAVDYAIRLNQFLDHYLKGKVAPRWMVRGIPAKLKGIDNGYELDSSTTVPESGLLMQKIEK